MKFYICDVTIEFIRLNEITREQDGWYQIKTNHTLRNLNLVMSSIHQSNVLKISMWSIVSNVGHVLTSRLCNNSHYGFPRNTPFVGVDINAVSIFPFEVNFKEKPFGKWLRHNWYLPLVCYTLYVVFMVFMQRVYGKKGTTGFENSTNFVE